MIKYGAFRVGGSEYYFPIALFLGILDGVDAWLNKREQGTGLRLHLTLEGVTWQPISLFDASEAVYFSCHTNSESMAFNEENMRAIIAKTKAKYQTAYPDDVDTWMLSMSASEVYTAATISTHQKVKLND